MTHPNARKRALVLVSGSSSAVAKRLKAATTAGYTKLR